jgi:hypothetical protein
VAINSSLSGHLEVEELTYSSTIAVAGGEKFTTTTGGYFAIHISSQTTKKEVSESPPL